MTDEQKIFEYIRDNININIRVSGGTSYSNKQIKVSVEIMDPSTGKYVEVASAQDSLE